MPNIDREQLPSLYITIPQTIDASVCNIERIVNKVISHSPEIINKYPASTRVMEPLISERCPTYSEIRKSKNMSVTLYNKYEEDDENYKKIIYVNEEPVKVTDEKTVKFNGEVGQLPELYVNGMFPGTEPVISGMVYEANNLVLLLDVNAIYKSKTVTLRLYGFKPNLLKEEAVLSSGATRWTSNLILAQNVLSEEKPFDTYSNSCVLTFTTLSGTSCWFMFQKPYAATPRIKDFNSDRTSDKDYLKYDLNGFTMKPNGCCLTTNSGLPASQVEPNYSTMEFKFNKYYYIKNLSSDVTIDIYAKKNDTVAIFISTDDTIDVYDMISGAPREILSSPLNYTTYDTKEDTPNTILFKAYSDTEINESICYLLTECNPLTGEETEVLRNDGTAITDNLRIEYEDLKNTPIVDETTGNKMFYYYTLHISSIKKYIPPIIQLVTSEDVNNLLVSITDDIPPSYDNMTDFENYFNEHIENNLIQYTRTNANYVYNYAKKQNQTDYYILIRIIDWTAIKNQELIYRMIINDRKNRELYKYWNEKDYYTDTTIDSSIIEAVVQRNTEEQGSRESNVLFKWVDDSRDKFSWYLKFERIKFVLFTIERNIDNIDIIDNLTSYTLERNVTEYQTSYSNLNKIDFTIYIGLPDETPVPSETGYETGYLTADWYYKGNRITKYSKLVSGNEQMHFNINDIYPTSEPLYSDYTLKINAIKNYNNKNIIIKIPKNDSITGEPYITGNVAYMHRNDESINGMTPRFTCTNQSDNDYYIFTYYVNKESLSQPQHEYMNTYFSVNFSQINYSYKSLCYKVTSTYGTENPSITVSDSVEVEYSSSNNWVVNCDLFVHPETSEVVIEFEPEVTKLHTFYVIGQPGLVISTDYNEIESVVLSDEEHGYGTTSDPLPYTAPARYNEDIRLKITRLSDDYLGFRYKFIYYLSIEIESYDFLYIPQDDCLFVASNNEIKWPNSTYNPNPEWINKIAVAFYITELIYKTYDIYIYFNDTFVQTGYQTTVTDSYNQLWSVTSNTAGTYEKYETVPGHLRSISWNFTLPDGETDDNSGYLGYIFNIYYSDDPYATPNNSSWNLISSSDNPDIHLDWTIGTLIDGSPTSLSGAVYCVKVTAVKKPINMNRVFNIVAIAPSNKQMLNVGDNVSIYYEDTPYINTAENGYTHVFIQSYIEEVDSHGSNVISRTPAYLESATLQNIKITGTDEYTVGNITDFLTDVRCVKAYTGTDLIDPPKLMIKNRSDDTVRIEPYSHYVTIKTKKDFYKNYKTIDSSSYVYTDYDFSNFLRLRQRINATDTNVQEMDSGFAKAYHVRSLFRIGTDNTLSVQNNVTNFHFLLNNKEITEIGNTGRSEDTHKEDLIFPNPNEPVHSEIPVDSSLNIRITPNSGWVYVGHDVVSVSLPNQATYDIFYDRDPSVAKMGEFTINIEKYFRKYNLKVKIQGVSNETGYFVTELDFKNDNTLDLYKYNRNNYYDLYICFNKEIIGYNTNATPIYNQIQGISVPGVVFINVKNDTYCGFAPTPTAVIHLTISRVNYENSPTLKFKIYAKNPSQSMIINKRINNQYPLISDTTPVTLVKDTSTGIVSESNSTYSISLD